MSDRLPTIAVKADNARGFRIINASAFNPEIHEEFDPTAVEPSPNEIPANWRSLQWKRQVALAKHLTGVEAKNGAEAVALIERHIAAANAEAAENSAPAETDEA